MASIGLNKIGPKLSIHPSKKVVLQSPYKAVAYKKPLEMLDIPGQKGLKLANNVNIDKQENSSYSEFALNELFEARVKNW